MISWLDGTQRGRGTGAATGVRLHGSTNNVTTGGVHLTGSAATAGGAGSCRLGIGAAALIGGNPDSGIGRDAGTGPTTGASALCHGSTMSPC